MPTHGVVGPLGWLKVWGLAAQGPLKFSSPGWKEFVGQELLKKMLKSFLQKNITGNRLKKLEVRYGVYSNGLLKQKLKTCKLWRIEKKNQVHLPISWAYMQTGLKRYALRENVREPETLILDANF